MMTLRPVRPHQNDPFFWIFFVDDDVARWYTYLTLGTIGTHLLST